MLDARPRLLKQIVKVYWSKKNLYLRRTCIRMSVQPADDVEERVWRAPIGGH